MNNDQIASTSAIQASRAGRLQEAMEHLRCTKEHATRFLQRIVGTADQPSLQNEASPASPEPCLSDVLEYLPDNVHGLCEEISSTIHELERILL